MLHRQQKSKIRLDESLLWCRLLSNENFLYDSGLQLDLHYVACARAIEKY